MGFWLPYMQETQQKTHAQQPLLHKSVRLLELLTLAHLLLLLYCASQMNRWWPWEQEALQTSVIPTSKKIIKSLGKSTAHHVVMSFLNQFILPISRPIYLSLRRLFVEGLKSEAQLTVLPIDFPYFGYVQVGEIQPQRFATGVLDS